MKFILNAFVYVMIFISIASGLSIKESIQVETEDGTLYTYTHTGAANDFVKATGEQSYTRILSSEGDELSLDSIYNLSNPMTSYKGDVSSFNTMYRNYTKNIKFSGIDFPYSQNQYAISMRSPSGLESDLSIKGWSIGQKGFNAENKISFVVPKLGASAISTAEREVSTEYIVSGAGNLSSNVLNLYTGRHPNTITQTKVSGSKFHFESGVSDVINQFGSDASSMLGDMGDVNITTERGRSDPAEDIRSKLNKGTINETEYLDLLDMYWENDIISDDRLLEDAKKFLDMKQITKARYDALFEKVEFKMLNRIDTKADLTKYTNEFLSGSLNKSSYLQLKFCFDL